MEEAILLDEVSETQKVLFLPGQSRNVCVRDVVCRGALGGKGPSTALYRFWLAEGMGDGKAGSGGDAALLLPAEEP